MKKLIITLALITSVAGMSSLVAQNRSGQRNETRKERRDNRQDFPSEAKLTDEQRKQMREINTTYRDKIKAVRDSKDSKAEQLDKIQKLRNEKREAIKKILTKEQQELFAEKMLRYDRGDRFSQKDNRPNRGDRNFNGPRRGDRKYSGRGMAMGMRGDCPFTDECCLLSTKIELTKEQKEQVEKLRENHQKDREEMRKKHQEDMEKILTTEQRKQLKEK